MCIRDSSGPSLRPGTGRPHVGGVGENCFASIWCYNRSGTFHAGGILGRRAQTDSDLSVRGYAFIPDGKEYALTSAVMPGSFDPVTYGHLDIIERASELFEDLIIAVVENPTKCCLFSLQERAEFLVQMVNHLTTVSYTHLT